MSQRIRVETSDQVATLTITDPARRNALDLDLAAEITAVFDELERREDVGAVVVTGEPPAFCAGANLSELGTPSPEHLQAIYEGFLRVGRSPLPTIAAVNGAAVGAGMNLALVCDVRVAGSSARFDSRFTRLGLHPGGGHTWLLARAIGHAAATAMVVFGEVIDASEALRLGLVWRTVDDSELLAVAHELAARAGMVPRELIRRVKDTMAAVPGLTTHPDAVKRELEPQLWSFAQPEFEDRLQALRTEISGRHQP